jgi:hypothetical protein
MLTWNNSGRGRKIYFAFRRQMGGAVLSAKRECGEPDGNVVDDHVLTVEVLRFAT